jgi:hypothetical protein
MELQQPRQQRGTWPNKMRKRQDSKFVTGYGFACGIEIICCQRHRSVMEVGIGSLVRRVEIVDDDVTGKNLHSAVLQCRLVLFGEKADNSATGLYGRRVDLRKMLVEALHPELVHADLRQFGAEVSPGGWKKLYVSGLNSRLIRKRIIKGENSAPRHSRSPRPTELKGTAPSSGGLQ